MMLYDYDDMTRLPLEVINFISIHNIEAYMRISSSRNGIHLRVNIPYDLHVFTKHCDTHYLMKKQKIGFHLLFNKGCSDWYIIKNYGV